MICTISLFALFQQWFGETYFRIFTQFGIDVANAPYELICCSLAKLNESFYKISV